MSFSLNELKPLADVVLEQGVPLLANIFLPGIGGTIASAIVPSIAAAFGLAPDASPADIAAAVQADPNAAAKLATVQEKHNELLDFAQKTLDANQAEVALEPTFLGRLFVGGWRPAMGWMGVFALAYQMLASLFRFTLLPTDIFAISLGAWTALAGVRGIEMVKGLSAAAPAGFSKLVKKGK